VILPFESEDALAGLAKCNTIMLYLVGGGFISYCLEVNQVLLRTWCKELQLPIVSTLYAKTPQAVFPAALNDCFQTYLFLRQRYPTARLILAGDSAGGNLCCGIAGLCLANGLQPPDQLHLIYPALKLEERYSPSLLHASFGTNILSLHAMQLILRHYLPEPGLARHWLASPFYLNDQFRPGRDDLPWPRAWPKTVFYLAGKDALRDQALETANRIPHADII
jgi:acetyl esterase/lipase